MMQRIDPQRSLLLVLVLFAVFFFKGSLSHAAGDDVAQIKDPKGTLSIFRDNIEIPFENGTVLKTHDTLKTGTDGAVGILFNDDTTLSLGPGSRFTIEDYVFDPDHSRFSLVIRLLKGSAAYASGLIAKLSPESVKFIAPSASIGIRGTKFVIHVNEQ